LLNAAATPKKAVGVGLKRLVDDVWEEADGGEDGASASGGGKKAKTAGKAKAAGKKGGKKVVMDEEVAACRGGCYTKKGDRDGTQSRRDLHLLIYALGDSSAVSENLSRLRSQVARNYRVNP